MIAATKAPPSESKRKYTISCPNCDKHYSYNPSIIGRRVQCSDCNTTFRIPNLQTPESSAPAVLSFTEPAHQESKRASHMLAIVGVLAAMTFTGLGLAVFDYLNSRPQPIAKQPSTTPPTKKHDDGQANRVTRSIKRGFIGSFTPHADAGALFEENETPLTEQADTQELEVSTDTPAEPVVDSGPKPESLPEPAQPKSPEEIQLEQDRRDIAQQVIAQFKEEGLLPQNENYDTITPFGELTWDDDVLTTLQKIRQLPNLEKLVLVTRERSGTSYVNALDIDDAAQLQQHIVTDRDPMAFGGWATIPQKLILSLGEDLSIDQPFSEQYLAIVAYPIEAHEGMFELHAEFASYPGLLLTDQHKAQASAQAQQLLGENAQCYCPLRLQFVRLELKEVRDSPNPTAEQLTKIVEAVRLHFKEKYSKRENPEIRYEERRDWFNTLESVTWSNKQDSYEVFLNSKEIRYSNKQNITYRSLFDNYRNTFNQLRAQREHDKRFAGTEDLGNKF